MRSGSRGSTGHPQWGTSRVLFVLESSYARIFAMSRHWRHVLDRADPQLEIPICFPFPPIPESRFGWKWGGSSIIQSPFPESRFGRERNRGPRRAGRTETPRAGDGNRGRARAPERPRGPGPSLANRGSRPGEPPGSRALARNPRSPSPSPSPICRGSGMDPRSPARLIIGGPLPSPSPICRGSGVHSHPHPRFARIRRGSSCSSPKYH